VAREPGHESPMKRLDWLLIRPHRSGRKRSETIDSVQRRIDDLVAQSTTRVLTETEVDRLADLEDRFDELTLSQCEAVRAPLVRDDPDLDERLSAEFDDMDLPEEEFEAWADARVAEFDCDRCPHASPYSLYPSNPCEMNAGPLLEILADHPGWTTHIGGIMSPARMLALAAFIDDCLKQGNHRTVEGIDTANYLVHARKFLVHWGGMGFGVEADTHADDPIETPEGTIGVRRSLEPTLLH
jgi:hypothetical protein